MLTATGGCSLKRDLTATLFYPLNQPAHSTFTTSSPFAFQQRDKLREHLRQRGIPTEIYYPLPLHLQSAFSYLKYREGAFPEAESASRASPCPSNLSGTNRNTAKSCSHSDFRLLRDDEIQDLENPIGEIKWTMSE